jgi:hypothetical protein
VPAGQRRWPRGPNGASCKCCSHRPLRDYKLHGSLLTIAGAMIYSMFEHLFCLSGKGHWAQALNDLRRAPINGAGKKMKTR